MATATWPSGISFIAQPSSYKESGPSGNVLRTPMDKGPPKSRRRFTSAPRLISGATDIMSDADVATFDDWFSDTVAGGSLPFRATNPRTGVLETYRFVDDYEVVHINDDKNRISMKLEQLP